MEFLQCWQRLQELMTPEIGGLENTMCDDRTFLFHKTDQDALNVAAMASESPISPMGQDGMDFQQGGGGYVMSHAARQKAVEKAVHQAPAAGGIRHRGRTGNFSAM